MTTRHRRPLALASAILFAFGCDGDASTGGADGWTATVDTLPGGIVRVVNTPPTSGAVAGWTLEEELRIGVGAEGSDGPASFGQLKGLVVTDEDLVAVLEAQAQEVRVFDREGNHLATHGREGEGPGEFSEANGLMLAPSGELWVPDHGNGRMSFLDPVTGYIDSSSMPVMRYGFVWGGAMLDDGRVVKPSLVPGPPRRNILRIHGPDMEPVDSVFLPDPPETDPEDPPTSMYWEAPGGLPRGYMGLPFASSGVSHFHPDGSIWSAPSLAESYRLFRTTLALDTMRVVETRRPAVPVDPALRDSAIASMQERLLERNGDIGDQSWEKVPETYPFVERIFSDDRGNLWVEAGTSEGSSWDVYDRDGVHLRTVHTDLALLPYLDPVVRGDELWAVATDEFDIPYVVRTRIVPLPSEGR